ncbi:MAG: hypothetical protein ACFFA6_13135 [Promethearchaeota archaeon]
MFKFSFKLNDLSLRSITIIQVAIASIISLLFQFLIPYWWQPLDTFQHGVKQHGDEGVNIVIFTISQWYFSLSIAWLIYRNNPYLNNFLIYSLVPLGIIVAYEFFFLFLFYDYIHLIPLLLDIFLLWKKRETLKQKFALFIILLNTVWLFSVYFLKLAYYREDLLIFIRNYLVYLVLWIYLSFLFRIKEVE